MSKTGLALAESSKEEIRERIASKASGGVIDAKDLRKPNAETTPKPSKKAANETPPPVDPSSDLERWRDAIATKPLKEVIHVFRPQSERTDLSVYVSQRSQDLVDLMSKELSRYRSRRVSKNELVETALELLILRFEDETGESISVAAPSRNKE